MVMRGSVMVARCAARIWPSLHGTAVQSHPQVRLRLPMTGSGEAMWAGRLASRLVPSGMRASIG